MKWVRLVVSLSQTHTQSVQRNNSVLSELAVDVSWVIFRCIGVYSWRVVIRDQKCPAIRGVLIREKSCDPW